MKNILITGAGSGLGRALALHYALRGCDVCVADKDREAGDQTVELIDQTQGTAFFEECDISSQSSVDALVASLQSRWQSVDVLINNAGVATAGSLDSESIEQWQWAIDINLLGQIRMTQAILPLIRHSNAYHRSIINIASQAGLTPVGHMGSYSVTKAGLITFAEGAHFELAPENIHVSVVCPAFFATNLHRSLRTEQDGMRALVNKMVGESDVTADSIAEQIVTANEAREFMILTHKDGRRAHMLKRLLPNAWYLRIVKKRMSKFSINASK